MIITICRKPFNGTVCDNVEKNSCGALNIRESRLSSKAKTFVDRGRDANGSSYNWANTDRKEMVYDGSKGRFPANVVITDCPSVLSQFPKDSLGCKPHRVVGNNRYEGWGTITAKDEIVGYDDGDNTCASRYFFRVRK